MFPIDVEAQNFLGSSASLCCIVWFLRYREIILPKQNSIIALKELVSCDQLLVEKLWEIEGINEILVELVRKQISQAITKASIMVIFHMVSSSNEKIKLAFVKMVFVSSLPETIFEF
jgi:hypothetical protein